MHRNSSMKNKYKVQKMGRIFLTAIFAFTQFSPIFIQSAAAANPFSGGMPGGDFDGSITIDNVLGISSSFNNANSGSADGDGVEDTQNFDGNSTWLQNITGAIEERYHIDKRSAQDFGEAMNSSVMKTKAPEVTLSFNPSEPKEGQKITATAYPMFFANPDEGFYFTWFLKRKGCDVDNSPNSDTRKLCDRDENGKITVNDWKIEAMRTLASDEFDPCIELEGAAHDTCVNNYYNSDTDSDGYNAKIGGENVNNNNTNRCYAHDWGNGQNYELSTTEEDSGSFCEHLFPDSKIPGLDTGDGSFGRDEEEFWQTDSKDPSTAKNGNKDEANVAGLGQKKFSWTYIAGDRVGVAVEGNSIISTKYRDGSMMVMWALPNNKCDVTNKGIKTMHVPGGVDVYDVDIPVGRVDFDECINDSTVDPLEGGQKGKIELKTNFFPENPVLKVVNNVEDSVSNGNILTVQSIANEASANPANIEYTWRVELNTDGIANGDNWKNITNPLMNNEVVANTKGTGLTTLKMNLTMPKDVFSGVNMNQAFPDGIGYFRVSILAQENFKEGAVRAGRDSVVVKVVLSDKELQILPVTVNGDGTVSTSSGAALCSTSDTLENQAICPVVRGEIVGVHFDNASGEYDNFSWTINKNVLSCSPSISSNKCPDATAQGSYNFFPVTGNVGESYTVAMTARNITSGKTITLRRDFKIVNPSIAIVSSDPNKTWPRYLGQYTGPDVATGQGSDFSKTSFEAFAGSTFEVKAIASPSFITDSSSFSWSVDGILFDANADGTISMATDKPVESIYNVAVKGVYRIDTSIQKAMYDIWKVPPFEVDDSGLFDQIQIQLVSPEDVAQGAPTKFFASIISYIPSSVLFLIRLALTAALMVFAVSLLFAFVPERKKI